MTINLPITAGAIARAVSFDSLLIQKGRKSTIVSVLPDFDFAACEVLAAHYSRHGFTLSMEPSESHIAYQSVTGTW